MSFKSLKGQNRAISFLKSSLRNEKIAHAYIFLGPSGIGKKLTALDFAKALNCQAEIGDAPCDSCISCRKIANSNHPDVFLLKPEKEGASIGIDVIRGLIRNIGLKPYEAKSKVYVIDDADSMTQEASNALLKTLEEPPPQSVVILIAEALRSLLPTIVSRAQIVRFFPLKIEEAKDILINEHNMDKTKAHILSHLSSGRLGEALKYKNEDFFERRTIILKELIAKTLFDSDFNGLSKSDFRLYLDIMLTWYRDILVAKAGFNEPSAFVNIDKKDAVLEEARVMDFRHLDNIIKQILSTNSFLDQNANPKLAMSVLGFKISNQ